MAELRFYHCTRTAPDLVLPTLLGRTLGAGQRAVVRCGSEARVAALDKALWAAEWLPHGSARTGHASLQPIWLTTLDERPNEAGFLFLLDGVEAPLAGWARVFDLFDGQDEHATAAARQRWTTGRAAGHELSYWRQGPTGWEKA